MFCEKESLVRLVSHLICPLLQHPVHTSVLAVVPGLGYCGSDLSAHLSFQPPPQSLLEEFRKLRLFQAHKNLPYCLVSLGHPFF